MLQQRQVASRLLAEDSPTLTVQITYHVLYNTEDQNIALDRIADNHTQLNRCFSMTNSDIDRVPTTGNYGFAKELVSDPKVLFLPVNDNSTVNVVRVSTSFTDISLTSSKPNYVANISPKVPGHLNIYIGNLENEVLGIAQLMSNICVVLYTTVGGTTFPGTEPSYNIGRTMVHEVGHCFGLEHPWMTDNCTRSVNGLPKSKNPNYIATLDDDGEFGNHDLDVKNLPCPIQGTSTSCCGGSPSTCCCSCTGADTVNGHYELFMNFMEYVDDENMVMFATGQSDAMYTWVNAQRASGGVLDVAFLDPSVTLPPPDVDDGSFNLAWLALIVPVAFAIIFLIIWYSVRH